MCVKISILNSYLSNYLYRCCTRFDKSERFPKRLQDLLCCLYFENIDFKFREFETVYRKCTLVILYIIGKVGLNS